ncbi:MAG: SDR family oxidoreductase [Clostridiales bacterium]|nr:SDR family oxidoreductase [Clostridiales bacterium]
MDGRLKGKTALITGGGTGLGADFAKRFVEEGAKVVITGRRKEPLEKVSEGLPKGSVLVFQGDVSEYEQAQAMVNATIEFGGRIDVLVNNAGIDPSGSIVELDIKQWQKVIDINLTGPFMLMKAAIPDMIKNGGGSIINVASLAALRCIPAMPAYIASKSGLIGLTQSAALDYGYANIRANIVCPGPIRTEMLENSMAPLAEALNTDITGALNTLTRFIPLKRPANPDEVSGAVVFLASDDSSFMTGTVIALDGGACIVDPCGVAVSSAGMNWGGGK